MNKSSVRASDRRSILVRRSCYNHEGHLAGKLLRHIQRIRGALISALVAVTSLAECQSYDFTSYGDLAQWRTTNFEPVAYRSNLATTPLIRLLTKRNNKLRPFIEAQLSYTSEEISQENVFTGFIGMEYRPGPVPGLPKDSLFQALRLYAEYGRQFALKNENPSWNPPEDSIVGAEAYQSYGVVNSRYAAPAGRTWAELYAGGAFHETDFYLVRYSDWRAGVDAKYGISAAMITPSVLPYIVVDSQISSHSSNFWNNQSYAGVGLRLQWGADGANGHALKLYCEQLWTIGYAGPGPAAGAGVPWSNLRIGLAYELNRF